MTENPYKEIAALKQEIWDLQKCCGQRGARMQIMREWLAGMESGSLWEGDDAWEALVEARPEAADWFDDRGVPK